VTWRDGLRWLWWTDWPSNLPGSKTAKRYQDVEELLAAGIPVTSTRNIQHLESLYNAVGAQIGVKVHGGSRMP
jgi:K+-sensing histidine kinase KdpD